MANLISEIRGAIKYWYLFLILGILFLYVGVQVFKTPVESYIALSILFSIIFLIGGIFEIVFAIVNNKNLENWGWVLAGGILNFLIGILLMSNPILSIRILPIFVGFTILFRSIQGISFAIDLRHWKSSAWGWVLFAAILGILTSFILLLNPIIAGFSIVLWTGLSLIFLGIYEVILGLSLRRTKKKLKKYSEEE